MSTSKSKAIRRLRRVGTPTWCQTGARLDVLQGQFPAKNGERPGVAREVIATDDVGEFEAPVQPPGPVGLLVDLGGGEQHLRFGAPGQQPPDQRLAETPALSPWVDV